MKYRASQQKTTQISSMYGHFESQRLDQATLRFEIDRADYRRSRRVKKPPLKPTQEYMRSISMNTVNAA